MFSARPFQLFANKRARGSTLLLLLLLLLLSSSLHPRLEPRVFSERGGAWNRLEFYIYFVSLLRIRFRYILLARERNWMYLRSIKNNYSSLKIITRCIIVPSRRTRGNDDNRSDNRFLFLPLPIIIIFPSSIPRLLRLIGLPPRDGIIGAPWCRRLKGKGGGGGGVASGRRVPSSSTRLAGHRPRS